jgi:hypothetical protein
MPTTFVGLLIFVAFLTPGFIFTAQRRMLVPQGTRSALLEITSVVSISLVTNGLTLAAFGILRAGAPAHTPDVGQILRQDSQYVVENLAYVLVWASAILGGSCFLALVAARWGRLRSVMNNLLQPVIVESSAWCETFAAESGSYVHTGLELSDGGYISGRLVWFSTDLEETGDRDLVLAPPLTIRTADDTVASLAMQRVIVSARDIRRIDVTYIGESSPEGTGPSHEDGCGHDYSRT